MCEAVKYYSMVICASDIPLEVLYTNICMVICASDIPLEVLYTNICMVICASDIPLEVLCTNLCIGKYKLQLHVLCGVLISAEGQC
jgi:hypothetical protein